MFGKSITLFRVFGIAVRVNVSWAFIAVLIAWSLAQGVFPRLYAGWPVSTYWWTAFGAVVGLFLSIVLHELAHSLVARAYGMPMRSITLFIFGGVAEMEREPRSPTVELTMAIAGPVVSALLAVFFYWVYSELKVANVSEPLTALAEYLGLLNAVVAVFNMVPAFPLDGGRVLRAILWRIRNDIFWATRWAARVGAAFGLGLIVMGVIWVLLGSFIAGLWWILIGMFVRAAARGSYYQLETRRVLEGETVKSLMGDLPEPAGPDMAVGTIVEEHFYEHHQEMVPVIEDGRLIGTISVAEVKTVPKQRRSVVTARDIMAPCTEENTVPPGEDVMDALARMQRAGAAWLVVVQDARPLGLLSQKHLMDYLALRIDLEGTD